MPGHRSRGYAGWQVHGEGGEHVYRSFFALVSVAAVLALAPAVGDQGNLAVLAAAVAILLTTAAVTRGRDQLVAKAAGSQVAHRQADEWGRRGAFQRQHRPDVQGRPRPRAPGNSLLPA